MYRIIWLSYGVWPFPSSGLFPLSSIKASGMATYSLYSVLLSTIIPGHKYSTPERESRASWDEVSESWWCSVGFSSWWCAKERQVGLAEREKSMIFHPLFLFLLPRHPLSHTYSVSPPPLSLLFPLPINHLSFSFTPSHKKLNVGDRVKCYCTNGVFPALCDVNDVSLDSIVGVLSGRCFNVWSKLQAISYQVHWTVLGLSSWKMSAELAEMMCSVGLLLLPFSYCMSLHFGHFLFPT